MTHNWMELVFTAGPDLFMCLRCGEMAYDKHYGPCSAGREIGTGLEPGKPCGQIEPPPHPHSK